MSAASAPPGFNFAHAFGIESTAAAGLFTVLYAPLLVFFLWKAIRHPCYVYIMLAVFCTIRVAAFLTRAILAGSETEGENLSFLVANLIIFNIGFFGLLYSAYSLVLDREEASAAPILTGIISRITRNRLLFRICLSAGVALSITGFVLGDTTTDKVQLGNTLRKIGTIIFLVLTILFTLQTILLVRQEQQFRAPSYSANSTPGTKYGMSILALIAGLLLVREAFLTATIGNSSKQNDERFWYPFVVLPEILVVVLFMVPGLVPAGSEDRGREVVKQDEGAEYAYA